MKKLGFLSIFFIATLSVTLLLAGCGGGEEEVCVNRASEGVVTTLIKILVKPLNFVFGPMTKIIS